MEELLATIYRTLKHMNRGIITTKEAYDILAEMEEKIRQAEEIVLDVEARDCYKEYLEKVEKIA